MNWSNKCYRHKEKNHEKTLSSLHPFSFEGRKSWNNWQKDLTQESWFSGVSPFPWPLTSHAGYDQSKEVMGVSEAGTHSKSAKAMLIRRTTRLCFDRAFPAFLFRIGSANFRFQFFPHPYLRWNGGASTWWAWPVLGALRTLGEPLESDVIHM